MKIKLLPGERTVKIRDEDRDNFFRVRESDLAKMIQETKEAKTTGEAVPVYILGPKSMLYEIRDGKLVSALMMGEGYEE